MTGRGPGSYQNASRETFWHDWAENLSWPNSAAPLHSGKIDRFFGAIAGRRRRLHGPARGQKAPSMSGSLTEGVRRKSRAEAPRGVISTRHGRLRLLGRNVPQLHRIRPPRIRKPHSNQTILATSTRSSHSANRPGGYPYAVYINARCYYFVVSPSRPIFPVG